MTRDTAPGSARPTVVWVLVSAAVAGTWAGVARTVASLGSEQVWTGTFEELLVAVASAALLTCASWLWIVTTLTIADLLAGRACSAQGLTRRLVLVACGVVVVAGVSSPALARGGADEPVLAGLPLPDRAVAGAPAGRAQEPRPATAPRPTVRHTPPVAAATGRPEPITVRTGDSLWSIAQADLGPDAGLHDVDERWRALYAANRAEIGDDPDLITPGQQLRPPLPETDQ
ncbi:LysM peptidoglycan-binding domain-containing protein [Nocardioides sp.]|uniref:LysM peptidoglycan-binding domain-containing protein n=1 Tax=Nocardioides sp. TaxID=35761 RepID=UPI002CE31388|nr:LysM peptidoglycan-binding domain-containing protein [Nocardioides sp.]HXH80446.1 LysM peptidoglycan-binding domain-containing protein [Nocardioides sp.]